MPWKSGPYHLWGRAIKGEESREPGAEVSTVYALDWGKEINQAHSRILEDLVSAGTSLPLTSYPHVGNLRLTSWPLLPTIRICKGFGRDSDFSRRGFWYPARSLWCQNIFPLIPPSTVLHLVKSVVGPLSTALISTAQTKLWISCPMRPVPFVQDLPASL